MDSIDAIVQHCIEKLEKDGFVKIDSEIRKVAPNITPDASILLPVAAKLTNTGKYVKEMFFNGDYVRSVTVFLNPNYEHEENMRQLQEQEVQSVIDTNSFQRKFGWGSLILSGFSVLFIAISAVLQYQDKTSEGVQQLKDSMSQSSRKLDSIALFLKEINSSIRATVDTIDLNAR